MSCNHICWSILWIIHISEVCVINHSQGIFNWKITCQYIQERNHINILIMLGHSIEITIYKDIWWNKMGRIPISLFTGNVINLLRNCDIQSHFVMHTGEKPYLCSEYNKVIPYKIWLNQHMALHTSEKP